MGNKFVRKNEVCTLNKGVLKTMSPFNRITGKADAYMGEAKNKKGKIFRIYSADCGSGNCMCAAVAIN